MISDAPRFMRGLRVMFATDFHIRDRTPDSYVADLAAMLAAQRADLLLLGGDYGESAAASKRFFSALAGKNFPLGIFGVPGNNDTESFEGHFELRRAFSGRLLVNELVDIHINHGRLYIGGLDELKYGAYPRQGLIPNDASGYSILVSHYPCIPAAVSGARPRLMLSGHTHGGQIRLLGLSIYSLGLEKDVVHAVSGISEHGATRLLVSPGIGLSRFPIRLGCAPMIHLIEFV